MGLACATDMNHMKTLAGNLASRDRTLLPFISEMKSDCGLNSNMTGWMLIPIEYLEDYDNNPIRYGLVLYTCTIINDHV